jgi:hypothetical protein
MDVWSIIDRVPELPYFLVGFMYLQSEGYQALNAFSSAFIFLTVCILSGLFLKATLKTTRPIPYPGLSFARYDVPSLHTMVSLGAVPFIYFIEPRYILLFLGISVVYMYSRVKLGFHTKKAVYVGAVMGILVGAATGHTLSDASFHPSVSGLLTFLFFMVPLSATVFRQSYISKIKKKTKNE